MLRHYARWDERRGRGAPKRSEGSPENRTLQKLSTPHGCRWCGALQQMGVGAPAGLPHAGPESAVSEGIPVATLAQSSKGPPSSLAQQDGRLTSAVLHSRLLGAATTPPDFCQRRVWRVVASKWPSIRVLSFGLFGGLAERPGSAEGVVVVKPNTKTRNEAKQDSVGWLTRYGRNRFNDMLRLAKQQVKEK